MDSLNDIIAQTYAQPLLELASETGNCEQIKSELEAVTNLLSHEQEFVTVLDSPFIAVNEKLALVQKVFSGRLNRLTEGLLAAVIRRKRIRFFEYITSTYSTLMDNQNGIKLIDVTLAAQMTDQEKDNLQKQLENAAASKIKIRYRIDPSILGGIIIQQEGTYVDNSLRRVLADAKNRIKNKIKT